MATIGWLLSLCLINGGGADAHGRAMRQQDQEPTQPLPRFDPLEEWLGIPVNGFLSMKYRLRSTSGASDSDLYEHLSLDIGDAEKHTITAHIFLRATEDLDGEHSEEGFFEFDGITDSYSSSVNARFYEGYIDVHRLGFVELIRAGRQFSYETPIILQYDGGRLETIAWKDVFDLRAGVYGGIPVHLYESSASGDWLFGAYAEARFFKGNRVRIDYIRAVDDYKDGEARDDYWALGVWQSILTDLFANLQFSILEGESRDLRVRVNWTEPEWDLHVDLSWYQLFQDQEILSIDQDFFFQSLLEYFPYMQGRLLVSKGFGENWIVQGGLDVRRLRDEDDEGSFNREFTHFYVGPSVSDWPWKGFTGSVMLDVWGVTGSDGDIFTFSLDLAQKFTDDFKAAIGTSWAAYKYDYFTESEREDVRTYYIKGTYDVNPQLKVDLGYEFEDADIGNFHTLKVGVGYSF